MVDTKNITKKRKALVSMIVVLILVGLGVGSYKIYSGYKVNRIMNAHSITQAQGVTIELDGGEIVTGVQQIMVGSLCNSYDHALQTLINMKEAGYNGIELNSFMVQDTALIVKLMTQAAGMPVGNGGSLDWYQLVEESGIEVISLHSDLGSLENDYKTVAEQAKKFGTNYVVITGMYRFDYSNLEEVQNLANRLNTVGKALAEEGIELLYHNHNCELQKVTSDKTAYDILIEKTDPEYVNFEFDSYWMADGGANVEKIMRKLGTRMKMWHINDRGYTKSGPYMTPILNENATELGNGNMDLEGLYAIAKDNGVKAIIVETHQNWVNNDPIESFIRSGQYLHSLG